MSGRKTRRRRKNASMTQSHKAAGRHSVEKCVPATLDVSVSQNAVSVSQNAFEQGDPSTAPQDNELPGVH